MKTYRHLWPRVCAWDNLERAYRNARRGKRRKVDVAAFEYNWEERLLVIEQELRDKTYRPGPYTHFTVHEPKRRLISAAPFRDRIVHHALCQIIEPIFERRFIHDSYANRVGKGTHRALDRCTQFARRYPYVLQCDIRQHFPSIDHAILREILFHHITCPDTRWLIDLILASGAGVLSEAYTMVYFPGDDLLAATRPRGLPIGNLTSQFWSNCTMNPFDQFVKRDLGCRAMIRYVDDMLFFAEDKQTLHDWLPRIIDYLAGLRLTIHAERAQPRPVTEGIPFLGFTVFPTHRRLKRRKLVLYRRQIRSLQAAYAAGRATQADVSASVRGWLAHVAYGDTHGLARSVLRTIVL